MENQILPYLLSNYNGSIVDTDSKVGSLIEIIPLKSREQETNESSKGLPEIVIYQDIKFGGASERTNLNWYYVGDWWNDKISSIVVVSGVWEFFEHHHYEGRKWTLRPGYYSWVVDAGIPNDIISSFRCIALTE